MNFGVFAFQAVPDAPKVQGTEHPAPTPEGAPAPPGGLGLFMPLLILVPFILVLFFQSRSQTKKQEANIAGLKKGDRVLTQSGLVGRLIAIEGRYARIELPPSGTKVTILRSGLLGRDTESESSTSQESSSEKPKPS
ncbi:MAG TPA: preprotein translocase subunit YajC [Polyangiaceae bacterium]|nr:preprotein translocase subunit YajC [Polyangiaceae bacterium]